MPHLARIQETRSGSVKKWILYKTLIQQTFFLFLRVVVANLISAFAIAIVVAFRLFNPDKTITSSLIGGSFRSYGGGMRDEQSRRQGSFNREVNSEFVMSRVDEIDN